MIIFDTETTGLVGPEAMPVARQPYITELCVIKVDPKTMQEVDCFNELINSPGRPPQSAEIVASTGITDAMLKDALPFENHIPRLIEMFLGEIHLVGHNCRFDVEMLRMDLTRCGKLLRFPWPPKHICTVEASYHINNYRMKLGDLYKHCTGLELKGSHRAINDVRATADCARWLIKEGKIKL